MAPVKRLKKASDTQKEVRKKPTAPTKKRCAAEKPVESQQMSAVQIWHCFSLFVKCVKLYVETMLELNGYIICMCLCLFEMLC